MIFCLFSYTIYFAGILVRHFICISSLYKGNSKRPGWELVGGLLSSTPANPQETPRKPPGNPQATMNR